jgi:hypothetical protein
VAATLVSTGSNVAGNVLGKFSFHLYPVKGPIAEGEAPPVISGSGSASFPGGEQSFVFPDGERFSGKFLMLTPRQSEVSDLATTWDSVFGTGYYVAHVLGSSAWHGGATISGSNGTSLQLEEIREHEEDQVVGVAKDSKGNLFKIAL